MKLSKITIFLILVLFLAATYALNNGLFDLSENQQYIFEHEETKKHNVDSEDFIEDEVVLGKKSKQSFQMSKKFVQSLILSYINPSLSIPIRPPKISS